MSQSHTNLIFHLVFSTKNRQNLISDEIKPRLYQYLGGIIRGFGGISLGIGGTRNHVHILSKIRADKCISDVMRDLKANSSGWINKTFPTPNRFSWQRGYGAFTVSASQIKRVQNYIENQEHHHQDFGFRVEYKKFLQANGVEFDERYLLK